MTNLKETIKIIQSLPDEAQITAGYVKNDRLEMIVITNSGLKGMVKRLEELEEDLRSEKEERLSSTFCEPYD